MTRELGGDQLADHAACAHGASGATGHRLYLRCDFLDMRDMDGVRVATGVGRVETINVGQQNKLISAGHNSHTGGEAIIVAKADF